MVFLATFTTVSLDFVSPVSLDAPAEFISERLFYRVSDGVKGFNYNGLNSEN